VCGLCHAQFIGTCTGKKMKAVRTPCRAGRWTAQVCAHPPSASIVLGNNGVVVIMTTRVRLGDVLPCVRGSHIPLFVFGLIDDGGAPAFSCAHYKCYAVLLYFRSTLAPPPVK
jgi:hypothetical protein